MRETIETFVASLAVPADRKAIVLAELVDHVACVTEAATREGRDPEAAARAALGDLEALRRSLEAVESAFRITRLHAFARGLVAAVLVAIVIDRLGMLAFGLVGAACAIAIAAVAAPARVLELLRAELRAPRIPGTLGRGLPIGPAIVYAYTVISAPFMIWMGVLVARAIGGDTAVDVPWSAFALMAAVYLVLLVEGIRARRLAVA
jgi:hypothetical protein